MIDTHGHMVAAYVVATIIYVLYSVSLWWRSRKYTHRHPEEHRDEGPLR